MLDLHPDEVVRQLGGFKTGPNDWRIPDVCVGETAVGDNPGFSLAVSDDGKLVYHCHRHEDQVAAGEALERALGSPRVRVAVGAGKAMTEKIERYQTISVAKFADVIVSNYGCPVCGSDAFYSGVTNGWPTLYCESGHSYDRILKSSLDLLEEGWKVRIKATYHNGEGKPLVSERVEPGKIISGSGSNQRMRPLPLIWTNDYVTATDEYLIVEGEKAAAAALSMGLQAISWRGGKAAWQHTDWKQLENLIPGMSVLVIWPDDHPTARRAMLHLGEMLADQKQYVRFVKNEGETNEDVADGWIVERESIDEYRQRIEGEEIETDLGDEVTLPTWCQSGGLYDVQRILSYLGPNLAYIWEPGISSETPSLVWADEVGYWHPMGRQHDWSRLSALILQGRRAALEDARREYGSQPEVMARIERNLRPNVNTREQSDARSNLGTPFHDGNPQSIPVFQANAASRHRNTGYLPFQNQCLDMANGSIMERYDVMTMGLMYDSEWSGYTWRPGAFSEDTLAAENIRRLARNVGDTTRVIVEMLMKCDRRISLLKSQGTGRGKSIIVDVMRRSLGSLVRIGDAANLQERAMQAQFPAANNNHCQGRIIVYPEVDKGKTEGAGLERLSIGGLVMLSGEPFLSTEEKFERRIERPRTGNPFLTMGTWSKKNDKGQQVIDWNVQGMFDPGTGRGRLWAWDIDEAGGEYLPEFAYESCTSDEGCEAFIDLLMQIAIASEGVPEIYTEDVLTYVYGLLENTKRDPDAEPAQRVNLADQRALLAITLFEQTSDWTNVLHVRGLAQTVDAIQRKAAESAGDKAKKIVSGTDQQWLAAIRAAFDLPSMRQLEVAGQQNKREHDGVKYNWPLRGFVLLEGGGDE